MKNKLRISLLIAMAFLALLMISCRKKQEPCFDEDTHYLISYESNGDGTCYVSEIRTDPSYTQSFVLEIPERSPAGDIVTEIRCEPFEIHLPELLSEKDYEEILTKLEQACTDGKLEKKDVELFTNRYKLATLTLFCPMAELAPVYERRDGAAEWDVQHSGRNVKALQVIMSYADYTPSDLKEDYDYLRDLTEQSDSENKETILASLPKFAENYGSYISEIKLPDTVKAITTESFYASCPFLTSVDLPDSLTTIPRRLFSPMVYLESVSIPNSVTEIGERAFYGCESLLSVNLPERLKMIKNAAFYECVNLQRINIPDSVAEVGTDAFTGCDSLRAEPFDNGYYLGNTDNPHFLFWKARDDSIRSITFHQNTKVIVNRALYNFRSLKEAVFLGDISQIPRELFSNCTELKSVAFEGTVTSIGEQAFFACFNLVNMELPSGLTAIEGAAFGSCKQISKIVIPNGVTHIGDRAFSNCGSLTELVISNSVLDIGSGAFSECDSLTEIVIPDSVVELGSGALMACKSLKNIVFSRRLAKIEESLLRGCSALETVLLPDSVKSIERDAFNACTSLKQITIPEGVERIEENAFLNCESLVSVSFPSSINQMESNAFDGCAKLIGPYVYDEVYYLGNSKAPYLVALRPVSKEIETCTLHQDTKFVVNGAFRDCASLTSVTLSPALLTLSDEAFMGCKQLSGVVLGESLTAIGARAFRGCDRLTSLVLPRGLNTLGDDIFYRSGFHVVYYGGSAEEWSKISLGDNPRLKSVKVYFYSETQPTEAGSCWRYVDGVPVAW